jgi:integrase
MRLGEALALQWGDVDFGSHEVRVARALSRDRIETPKSGHGRTVDMSEQLSRVLLPLQVERKTETLRRRLGRISALGVLHGGRHHCLRHAFASLLLQQGESPTDVQRQLGYGSIQLTVDTYGKWLPMGNKAAVNRLDDPSGSNVRRSAQRRRHGGRSKA